jgi:hypothetical protein
LLVRLEPQLRWSEWNQPLLYVLSVAILSFFTSFSLTESIRSRLSLRPATFADDSRVVMKGSSGNFELLADPTKQNNGFVATNLCLKETGDGSARLFNGPSLRADDMTS